MLDERNIKVHIFEGVDVTGKTSQAKELVRYLGDKGEYFKFPRKIVEVDKPNQILFELPFIDKAFEHIHDINSEVVNIVLINGNKIYVTNIYKLFDMIHKYIYNNTAEKVYKDFVISNNSIIKDIIIVDIIANAQDKYNFIFSDLYKCISNDKVAILDRFFISGDVYNCCVPLDYISNLISPTLLNDNNSKLRDKFYDTIKQLFKISSVATNSLKLMMNQIVNSEKNVSESSVLPTFNSLFNTLYYFDPKYMNIILDVDKIVHYYFEPSTILYENFKKKNEENKQDREVSQYDTNEFVRIFAIKEYKDLFKRLSKTNNKVGIIDTDVLINCIKLDSKTKEISNPIEKFFNYFKLYVKD